MNYELGERKLSKTEGKTIQIFLSFVFLSLKFLQRHRNNLMEREKEEY